MLNRSKTLAASLLAATFLLGIAVGGVGMAAWGDKDDAGRSRSRGRVSYAERLAEQLDLTAAQRDSVAVILAQRQEAMRQLWQAVHPRFDSLRLQIRRDIMALLDTEQQAAYETLIARNDSLRGEHTRRHGEGR